ncbi:MAG: gliding motility-associated ABC transporter ATP-binding subunit GldA [Desulfobulbaceae bacterium]
MIKATSLTRTYGEFVAVDKVSFEIGQGEIVGLLGHNGAGKTTIMKMLTGYLEPTAGTIEIDGVPLTAGRRQLMERIGYLPENCPLYPEMTVVEYLEYAADLHGIPREERSKRVAAAIARTALTPKATQPISTLSRGYRQRVGVAQAILHEPGILILDEPTNGLDPTQIQQMRSLITDLAKSATVIISTHILQEVQAVCDRVIIISSGRIVLDSRLADLQADARLILRTGAAPDTVRELAETVPEITGVSEQAPRNGEPGHCYILSLAQDCDRYMISASLADRLREGGWPLYAIHPETRDLESVFAEKSMQQGGDGR